MFTNATITIFNKRLDAESRRERFSPTVIRGVSYVESMGATVGSSGVWGEDVRFKIRIPFRAWVQDKRIYLPEGQYKALDDADLLFHWTITKGDLILKGEWPGDPMFEDAIQQLVKSNALRLIHVTEYADDTDGGSLYLKHYRIGGK